MAKLINPTLREKIGQMLLVGFRGYSVSSGDPVMGDVRERNLGGVVLFDQEMADTTLKGRNIQSPEQVKALVDSLQSQAPSPLLVCIDQEGGRVNRLKPIYGFPETISHEELGRLNDPDITLDRARRIAETLRSLGINLNFAPVVDLDANPDNPIIKGKMRSFHHDPEVVARHAIAYAHAHLQQGVMTCAKHFPGHGSAMGDTHLGLVDVTKTWHERELIPFQRLIEEGMCPFIMTAHVFNANLDPQFPATLSKAVLRGMLRDRLGFEGVIVSDDMEMGAISGHYGLEKAIELGINAGLDLLCFGNNMKFDADIGAKATTIVASLVEQGKISEARIDESFTRIQRVKETLAGIPDTN